MAVTVGTLSALEQAAQVARKPAMLGANALRSYLTPAEWSTALTWATGGSGGGTNQSRTDAPPRWVHDGRLDARSRPNVSGVSSYYLLFELDAATLDAAVLANHNFAEIAGCIVRFGVADDSTYSTNRRVIAQWANFGSERLVALDLTDGGAHDQGEYRRFTGVRYAYLEVVTSGTFGATVPRVGEIFLGQGRRLARAHDYPGDELQLESRTDEYEADGGAVARFVRHRGRRVVDLQWTADSEDALGDDVATWRALFETDTEDGTLPLFYVRDPATPSDAPLLLVEPQQRFEHLGPHHARRPFAGRELPPFVRAEAAAAGDVLADPWLDWIVAYSAEEAAGLGPYTWPPNRGTGPTLSTSDAYSGGELTSPLIPRGIGLARVDGALIPGASGFSGAGFSWPAGAVHIRCVFRNVSETNGNRLWDWLGGGATDRVYARWTSSTALLVVWQDTGDGAVYPTAVTIPDDAWHLLDVVVDPTGGAGGVSRMRIYLDGAEVSTVDHSVAIQPEGSGTLYIGQPPTLGPLLFWGLRPGTGIDLATHQAHAAGMGV